MARSQIGQNQRNQASIRLRLAFEIASSIVPRVRKCSGAARITTAWARARSRYAAARRASRGLVSKPSQDLFYQARPGRLRFPESRPLDPTTPDSKRPKAAAPASELPQAGESARREW